MFRSHRVPLVKALTKLGFKGIGPASDPNKKMIYHKFNVTVKVTFNHKYKAVGQVLGDAMGEFDTNSGKAMLGWVKWIIKGTNGKNPDGDLV